MDPNCPGQQSSRWAPWATASASPKNVKNPHFQFYPKSTESCTSRWRQQSVLPALWCMLRSQNHLTRVWSNTIRYPELRTFLDRQGFLDPACFLVLSPNMSLSPKPLSRHTWIQAVIQMPSVVFGLCAFVCCVHISLHHLSNLPNFKIYVT